MNSKQRSIPIHHKSKQIPSAPVSEAHRDFTPGLVQTNYPTVALVGRPNVGKSSIFNALLKREISITDARAGTTRDRVLHPVVLSGKPCDLMDTGGIGIVDAQQLSAEIESQIQKAIHAATMLVHVVDAQEGLTPLDREVSARLRKLNRPMLIAANKIEGKEAKVSVNEFAELGVEPIVPVSALHRHGLDDLEEAIAAKIPMVDERVDEWEEMPRIAVVGRRNVGKSSFCNALAKEERTIVSSIPGTTRDSVDVLLEKDNQRFVLVDTAGLRRMKEPEGPVEFFSQVRTERALRRCDVVLLMLASREGISTTDRKLCDQISEECKPTLIVVNKWDESKGVQTGTYLKYIEERLPSLRHAPVAFTTAITGTRCWQSIDVALDLYKKSSTQIPTPVLNKAIERAEFEHEPPAAKGFKPRLLYGVQVAVRPPTIVINCRHADKIDKKYGRYLQNRLREILDLDEIPIRIFLRDSPR
ncbi:MAG TPA: ribosome biogenesis GTPase Der [Planctomycetota bacterium]|nr:ribosome biogenesis GTPase Der [Planctomycetota bacterium]